MLASDAQRFRGRADLSMANPAAAASLLAGRDEDGAWRFDADQRHTTGPFVGKDYHELGPDNAVELGTCARKAYEVLNYARIAGDPTAYEAMRKTLGLMESFRVPRAAQVWEVPVHTPDVLAAADAVDAYVEAYRFSRDERLASRRRDVGSTGPAVHLSLERFREAVPRGCQHPRVRGHLVSGLVVWPAPFSGTVCDMPTRC